MGTTKILSSTMPIYNLFGYYKKWNENPLKRECFITSDTCSDFVSKSFKILHNLGATFEVKSLPRDFINVYTNQPPKLVDFDDPKTHVKIVEFYEMLEAKFKELGLFHFVLEFWRIIVEGEMYQNINRKFYYIKTKLPVMNWKYVEDDISN
eukprot:EC823704.1.p1 GENE.EC823704.1~~EC823704.1.p1  ORF type:complete len:151 (+),score=44.01 EC823704.1:193-645(+)